MNRQVRCILLLIVAIVCLSDNKVASVHAVVQETEDNTYNFPDYISSEHQIVLEKWLKTKPSFRLANESDLREALLHEY